jgi:hypothetical protein
MCKKVHLALEGIPMHAWEPKVIEDLLGKSCVVDEVAPEMSSWSNLSLVKLTVWTSDLDSILVARTLVIPEPPHMDSRASQQFPFLIISEVKALQYKVLVHLTSVEEDVDSVAGDSSSLQPGHGANGRRGPNSGEGGGDGGGGCWISHVVQWHRGCPVLHGRSSVGGRQGSGQTSTRVADLGWPFLSIRAHAPIMVVLVLSKAV